MKGIKGRNEEEKKEKYRGIEYRGSRLPGSLWAAPPGFYSRLGGAGPL